ncbi:tripartite tricarboxylate transporter TctB family protein [Pelagibacterium sp. H642]|uniref:tripartite tricarboxylate transporter TctB family protein n=1 Tax=Pelagibacterium sp. H642 TaxID=1881069 RepID=UPI002815FD80|nr:tripartite tricarboxylate transporter TctB family protein [Pelagibacterium sp. H642]WMT91120.1 tripartite tricarboxylate transporter TctB family protein [Pelagibacterium sp. H642]
MSIKLLDIVLAALFLAFGLYVIGSAFAFGITSDTGPGSGTFPLIAGLLMAVFAGGTLYRALRRENAPGAAIGIGEVARVAGLLALLGLYIAAFEPLGAFLPLPFLIIGSSLIIHWRTDPMWLAQLGALALGFTVVCYLVFAVFLRVLLPTGPLGF